jgi:hypothetical protein
MRFQALRKKSRKSSVILDSSLTLNIKCGRAFLDATSSNFYVLAISFSNYRIRSEKVPGDIDPNFNVSLKIPLEGKGLQDWISSCYLHAVVLKVDSESNSTLVGTAFVDLRFDILSLKKSCMVQIKDIYDDQVVAGLLELDLNLNFDIDAYKLDQISFKVGYSVSYPL